MEAKLSVVIPAYNERETLPGVLDRVRALPLTTEVVVVDDGSTDGTREWLLTLADQPGMRVLFQERNQGKAGAVGRGLREATGQYVVIQDADLEYSPEDLPHLVAELDRGDCDVVYGSRFLKGPEKILLRSWAANKVLSVFTSLVYLTWITDMETCYKMFRRDVAQRLRITSKRFELEPEITGRVLRMGCRLREVPVRYRGRTYAEGKKIGFKDFLAALVAIVRFRFCSLAEPPEGNAHGAAGR